MKKKKKAKTQLPLIYLEFFLRQKITNQIILHMLNYIQFYTKQNTLTSSLRFSDTLGHILLTDAQNNCFAMLSRSTYILVLIILNIGNTWILILLCIFLLSGDLPYSFLMPITFILENIFKFLLFILNKSL